MSAKSKQDSIRILGFHCPPLFSLPPLLLSFLLQKLALLVSVHTLEKLVSLFLLLLVCRCLPCLSFLLVIQLLDLRDLRLTCSFQTTLDLGTEVARLRQAISEPNKIGEKLRGWAGGRGEREVQAFAGLESIKPRENVLVLKLKNNLRV